MIAPTKRLKQFVELYENKSTLFDKIGVDQATMSKILGGERGASSKTIERVCTFTGWKFEEAWEIIEGETEE